MKIEYIERQTFRQEPDCYDGKECNGHRPRWMTSYPKEGDEEDGETLKLEMDARLWPPGTRVTIEVPACPKCGEPSDFAAKTRLRKDSEGVYQSVEIRHRKWPNCRCGFSWRKWVEENFS
jgi:hypothetical protein